MKKILKLLPLLLISFDLMGQITPISSEYLFNPVLINPASAGNRGALDASAYYRNQWVSIKGAPVTMTFSVDAPVSNEKIGLGLDIVNDRIGVTKETTFNTNYSYKINIGEGFLSFGLSAGISLSNSNLSNLTVLDPGDQVYLNGSDTYLIPNFRVGLFYTYHKLNVGFSMPELLTTTFNSNKNKYILSFSPTKNTYLSFIGYTFNLNSRINLMPSLLINYFPHEQIQYDINTNLGLLNKFFVGMSYRNNRAIVGLLQFQINNQFRIAYSYDFEIGYLGNFSNGSHELMLRYEFKYKVNTVSPLNL